MSPTNAKFAHPRVGERIGNRTVASSEARPNERGMLEWLMRCDAGHEKWCEASKMKAGRNHNCGACIVEARAAKPARPAPVSSSRAAHTNPRPSKATYAARAAAEWVARQPGPVRTIDAAIHDGTDLAIMRQRLERAVSLGLLRHIPGEGNEPERWGAPIVEASAA